MAAATAHTDATRLYPLSTISVALAYVVEPLINRPDTRLSLLASHALYP